MRLWPRRQGSSLDLLVVGLGNPGREYARNRHNAGAMVVDELARRYGGAWRSKFSGQSAEIRLEGHKLALLKPETYMNESGRSVGAAARFFKVEPDSVLVVHDDTDLEAGRLQVRLGGGLAGHNGLRSIEQHLKSPNFLRLRVASDGRSAATRARSPTGCSPTSPRTTTRKRSSPAPPTPSRPSTPKAWSARRRRSTAVSSDAGRHCGAPTRVWSTPRDGWRRRREPLATSLDDQALTAEALPDHVGRDSSTASAAAWLRTSILARGRARRGWARGRRGRPGRERWSWMSGSGLSQAGRSNGSGWTLAAWP